MGILIEYGAETAGLVVTLCMVYLSIKAKDLATKSQIGDITREVQKVKDEFISKQVLVKKDLDRLLSDEIAYRNEERTAVINFSLSVNEWLYKTDSFNFGKYNTSNMTEFESKENQLSELYCTVGVDKSKVFLLIDDQDLKDSAESLFVVANDFNKWLMLHLIDLRACLIKIDFFDKELKNGVIDVDKQRDIKLRRSEAVGATFALKEKMVREKTEQKKDLATGQKGYNEVCKKYLRGYL